MKTASALCVVVAMAFHTMKAQYNQANLYLQQGNEKYRYENLQLYPVFATEAFLVRHQKLGPYLSLEEALKQNKILITERVEAAATGTQARRQGNPIEQTSDAAEVNKLFVENISADTIIILGGELIRGGKQDRMIAQDFMVLPHSGKVDIAVFCVEHGRWSAPAGEITFMTLQGVAPNKVRKAGAKSRKQQLVWDEVAELNEDLDIKTATGALAHALESPDYKKKVAAYEDHFNMTWPENVVGIIAISGDEVIGCDLFATHGLFVTYIPRLLRSYVSNLSKIDTHNPQQDETARAYLDALIGKKESQQDEFIREKGTQLKHGKYRLHISTF